ncbi:MAG: hypothetical protein HGA45_14010 [Chloroflexales bacterium]|nr:hypothetical protein [Chloroflexales bacterium]
MAKQLYQLANVQEAFAARIREKVQGRREEAQDKADDIPLLGWLIRPLTGLAFDIREDRNTGRGERGENQVLKTVLRWLPESWCVFHNVVVEPQPDEFAQIDLLLVSTAGVFLVETKAWRGSYKGYRDSWQQREGQSWIKVSSPTGQVQRQARMLASWLEQQRSFALPASFKGAMTPLVVFTQPQWLHVAQCSVQVFEGTKPLIQFLQARSAEVFTPGQMETICDLIIRSPTPVVLPVAPEPAPAKTPHPPRTPERAARPAVAPAAAEPANTPATVPASKRPAPAPPASVASTAPVCPKCGVAMVLRTAKQGANAGSQFYGCPNFPRCRTIISLSPTAE